MKTGIQALACAAMLATSVHAQQVVPEMNHLNWADVSRNRLSIQIMLDFTKPLTLKKRVDKEKHQLQFLFPGMTLQTFNPQLVIPKLAALKQMGLASDILVVQKGTTIPKIMLAIEFAPYREIVDKDSTTEKRPNKLLIKWSTLESPNRLMVDIFLKEDLDKFTKKDAIFLHASNDVAQSDTPIAHNADYDNGPSRIIIDAGHGGSDTGAKAWGLMEKDLALDVAKRVYKQLKNDGYQVFLTRNCDKEISLKDRADLAYQMRADFFISIHVNASAVTGGKAWGIETYYLNNTEMMPAHDRTGFLFVNLEKNINIVNRLSQHLRSTMNASQALARDIHTNLLATLQKNAIPLSNRGVKPEKFRTFLQSGIPAALVEVGFITNRTEADRLAQSSYRKLLAEGVYKGICAKVKK